MSFALLCLAKGLNRKIHDEALRAVNRQGHIVVSCWLARHETIPFHHGDNLVIANYMSVFLPAGVINCSWE